MEEKISYIVLGFVIICLELIQISLSKSKSKKYILPIVSFIFSIFVMVNLIGSELANYRGSANLGLNVININTWMMFPVLNIPTLMFILTSFITNNTLTMQKDKDLER